MESTNLVDELVGDSLFDTRDALTDAWSPDHLIGREDELKRLVKRLKPIADGDTPRELMVYGPNGSGKTEAVSYVFNEYQTAEQVDVPVETRLIDCSGATTTNELSRRVINAFRDPRNEVKYGEQNLVKKIAPELDQTEIASKASEQKPIILIGLDEIGRAADTDEFLYQLTRANEKDLENVRVSLVGVSVDGSVFDNISPDSESSFSPLKINFESYDAPDLQNILKQRAAIAFRDTTVSKQQTLNDTVQLNLESEVLADDVIPLIAAKATADGAGDARRALDLLWVAGDLASDNPEADRITKEHVIGAERELDRVAVISVLEGLDDTCREVAYALTTLVAGGEENPKTGRVYERYKRLANHGGKDPKTKRQVRDHLNRLEGCGLITREETDAHGNPYAHSLNGYSVEQVMEGLQDQIEFFGVHEQVATNFDSVKAEVGH